MLVNVHTASGIVLDYLVAVCDGMNPRCMTEEAAYVADVMEQNLNLGDYVVVLLRNNRLTSLAKYAGYDDGVCWSTKFSPSLIWEQAGPIIEREKYSYRYDAGHAGDVDNNWTVQQSKYPFSLYHGETMIIASMRCYVASKLGDVVEVPDLLVEHANDPD